MSAKFESYCTERSNTESVLSDLFKAGRANSLTDSEILDDLKDCLYNIDVKAEIIPE